MLSSAPVFWRYCSSIAINLSLIGSFNCSGGAPSWTALLAASTVAKAISWYLAFNSNTSISSSPWSIIMSPSPMSPPGRAMPLLAGISGTSGLETAAMVFSALFMSLSPSSNNSAPTIPPACILVGGPEGKKSSGLGAIPGLNGGACIFCVWRIFWIA